MHFRNKPLCSSLHTIFQSPQPLLRPWVRSSQAAQQRSCKPESLRRTRKIMSYKKALLAGTLALLAIPAFSQSSPAPVINQRKENQQDRIANGVQSGQLTAGETKNLEKKEAGLNAEENRMEKRDNGNLTARDKARLTRQQNSLSNQIYRDKHN